MESTMASSSLPNVPDLHRAVINNDTETVKELTSKVPRIINEEYHGKTAIYSAITNENIPMVKLLFGLGVDINSISYCIEYCAKETPVVTAARCRQPKIVEILLAKYKQDDNIESQLPKSALQWAAGNGDIETARLLLSNGADVNWIGSYFRTALHYATYSDHAEMVNLLLDHDANVTIDADGRSPLHVASVRGNLTIVQYLTKKSIPLDQIDNFGFSPLDLACLRGHVKVAEHLLTLNRGLDVNSALMQSAENNHIPCMQLLLDFGADINFRNSNLETPLHVATYRHAESTEFLIEKNANMDLKDSRDYTPVQNAVIKDRVEVLRILIQHGARVTGIEHTSQINIAMKHKNPELIQWLIYGGYKLQIDRGLNQTFLKRQLNILSQTPLSLQTADLKADIECHIFLLERQSNALSLKELSRLCLRSRLQEVRNGKSIKAGIGALPLPNRLKDYVAILNCSI
ncbi:unnamed protein product [Owenia fusiformis]|uniref:Uncharacterized protein n=1 Tax=Owenia fusiformis TaxID=6347 RepID=A0A8J1TCZ5_OWEFU|nr:unnamed protein product [Owenia fusiformis]